MLWLKAFHIVFVVTWFAGLFYLPRLFVYHAQASDAVSLDRFATMERRLLVITHVGAVLALGFGLAMLALAPGWLDFAWMHAKLALVVLLVAYHASAVVLARALQAGRARSVRWYRLYNELPALLLVGIVVLVVVKPF
ncbi:MAG TPA: CopD family protein [Candidatus Saccharimonadia bacterium]|nr:CopD family protein [Candidatus Saccharimonadia bacterium]